MTSGAGPAKTLRLPDHLPLTAKQLTLENEELRKMNAALVRSNQELTQFTIAASHDLQEPLRGITVYAELLERKYGQRHDEQFMMFADNIIQGAQRMKALLSDLLACAEIDTISDDLGETVDLNVVLEKVRQTLHASIVENDASVVCTGLPVISAAHEFHFVQLFQNLVANALKYRSELKPLIRVSVHDVAGNLEFAVADNGLGVAPEYHQKIFQPFQRLHDNPSTGTGIGLTICQRVVERYGGRIWVDSERGQGATFGFTLPNIEFRYKEPVPSARSVDSKVRILVVDSNTADVSLFRFAFERAELNCALTTFADSAELLALVRQSAPDDPPADLTVLVNLPKCDGLQVLRAMRDSRAFALVPVVVIDSGLSPRAVAKIQKFRLAHHIAKPATLEDFLSVGSRLKALVERNSSVRSLRAWA